MAHRRNEALLAELLSEVNRLRTGVRSRRSLALTTVGRHELAQSYDALANALEAYANEASESGVPLPYRFRDELRLYRSMSQK